MYQLGLQYRSISNLGKTFEFMVQILQKDMTNHRIFFSRSLFLPLNDFRRKKSFGMPSYMVQKNHKNQVPYFFFLNLSFGEDITVHSMEHGAWYLLVCFLVEGLVVEDDGGEGSQGSFGTGEQHLTVPGKILCFYRFLHQLLLFSSGM